MTLTKLNIPNWFECGFNLKIASAPTISNVGKVAAIHALDAQITPAQKFARGYSHLPIFYENTLSPEQRCYVLLSDVFPGVGHSDAQIASAAAAVASRITPLSVIGDQFTEGGANQVPYADYWTVATKFYQGVCNNLGVAGAAQHNFMHNYDTKLTNFSDFFKIGGVSGRDPLHAYLTGALASEAGARMKAEMENGVQKSNPFYTSGLHNWTNAFTMALWANDGQVKDWFTNWFFQTQVTYAAKADAKTLVYLSPWGQSLTTPQNEHHKNPGWEREMEGGHWKTPNWHIVPLQKMLWGGFFGCLLAEGVYMWEVGLNFSNNKADDRVDPYAPAETWVPTNGSPAPVRQAYGEPYYPKYPRSGADAVAVGVHWYDQIKHIVNASSGLAYASYTTNAGTVNIQPGDPRLFRRGFRNFGQDTILHHAAAERGVGLACEGAGETLLVYLNSYLGTSKTENVTMHFGGNNYPLGNLHGNTLYVFRAS